MATQTKSTTDPKALHARLLSIRVQLLVITSSVILFFVAVLVTLDYRREIHHHFQEKHADLIDEARTILPGVLHLRNHGNDVVQKYIDRICLRMDDENSPEHHIAVSINEDQLLHADSSHPISRDLLSSIITASESNTQYLKPEDQDLLIAVYSEGDTRVIVSENVTQLRSAVVGDEIFRLFGIGLMGLIANGIVNILLVRLIGRPLESLADHVRVIGQGEFGVQSPSFSTRELTYLSTEINHMSDSLATSERDRRVRLQKARDIQQNLLPHNIDIPGVNIAITYNPAEEVGGDYLDILPLSNNRWLVYVADATGHGVPAAMSAAMLKTLLLQASERLVSPAEILCEMNRIFMQVHIFGDFASVILLTIDLDKQNINYANAGHDPAWLIDGYGNPTELAATGTILGIDEDATWEDETIKLTANCRLAVSTDGITETFGPDESMFSKSRLLEALLCYQNQSLADTNAYARNMVDTHRSTGEQTDDVTLLLMEFPLEDCAVATAPLIHAKMTR